MAELLTYRFECEGHAASTFSVARFTGEEGISQLYRFEIDLVSEDPDIDVDDLLDQPSRFSIHDGSRERVVQGVLADVEILHQVDELTVYRVVLVPRAWELTLSQANRVYIDTTVENIIEQTLGRIGVTSNDYQHTFDATPREWPFRLQYGESDWLFLSRVLERDGIYYYFAPGADSEEIRFTDNRINQEPITEATLRFAAALGMDSGDVGDTVHALVRRQRRLPHTLLVQNYNDARPSTRINAEAIVDARGSGEVNLYGLNVLDQEEADELAEIYAQEIRCTKVVYHGESTVFRLMPGYQYTLTGHFRAEANQEYLVTRIEHSGHDPKVASRVGRVPAEGTPPYENRFTAIPAEVQFRPARDTEKPRIHGTLNARVDAAGEGEYAELDEEGRYHIIFPFDTEHSEGKASHWVRMMQPYGGENEGMHFPLRKRARVLVAFLGGDPDLPVIAGTISNAEQGSVINSDNHTRGVIRTAGGNRIEAEDNESGRRLALFSPHRRSYFHLGAESEGTGSDGISAGTDGMYRAASLGGSHSLTTTERVLEKLVPSTEGEAQPKGDADVLTVAYQQANIFSFPNLKFPYDRGSEDGWWYSSRTHDGDELDQDSETSGDFMIDRTVGPVYRYRDGVRYTFHALGAANIAFGPRISLATANAAPDGETLTDLYRMAFTTMPEKGAWDFDEDSPPASIDDKRLADFLERLPKAVADKVDSTSDEGKKWLNLLSRGHVSLTKGDAFKWEVGNVYDFGGGWSYVFGNGYEESHVSSKAVLNRKHRLNWPSDVGDDERRGRQSIEMLVLPTVAALTVGVGAGFAGGGGAGAMAKGIAGAFVSQALLTIPSVATGMGYNREFQENVGDVIGGPNSGEILTHAGMVRSSFKDPEDADSEQTFPGRYDFSNEGINPDLNPPLHTETTSVSKTFSDSYSYTHGNSINITRGDSEEHYRGDIFEFKYGGRRESVSYNGRGIMTGYERSASGKKVEMAFDAITGSLNSYSYSDHGHFNFSAALPALPRVNIDISMAPIDINASLKASMSVDISGSAAAAAIFDFSVGLKAEITGSIGGHAKLDMVTGEAEAKFVGMKAQKEAALKAEKKDLVLSQLVTDLEAKNVQLTNAGVELKSGKVALNSGTVFNL